MAGEHLPEKISQRVEDRMFRTGLRPRYAAYLIVSLWLAAVVVFGIVERISDPDTFPSVWLAFWWAIQTVTTVGYGDVVPRQTSGKFFAALLMLGGLSLLTVLTATVTSAFVARRQAERVASGEDPVMRRLEEISGKIDDLEADLRLARPEDETGERS